MAEKPHLDFVRINTNALSSIDSILQSYLPGGKFRGHEYQALNPNRIDKSIGSFSINTSTGEWSDFATYDKGGDCISLIAYILGTSQYEAAKELAEFMGDMPVTAPQIVKKSDGEYELITTISSTVETPNFVHPKHGKASQHWTYHDANGLPVFHMCRFDSPSGKSYSPLTLWHSKSKGYKWRWMGYAQPYPLYNLHLLKKYPEASVVVCEGEKAAEAASKIFPLPHFVTTTFAHGANAINKTEWKTLHGRDVILWPDHDHAGQQCVSSLINLLGGKLCVQTKTSLQTVLK